MLFAGDPTSSGPVRLAIQVRLAKLPAVGKRSGTAGVMGPRPKVLSGKAFSANCIVTGRNLDRAGELQRLGFPGRQPADGQKYKVCRWRLSSPRLFWRGVRALGAR